MPHLQVGAVANVRYEMPRLVVQHAHEVRVEAALLAVQPEFGAKLVALEAPSTRGIGAPLLFLRQLGIMASQ